jgi:hypothetical protein
VNGEILDLTGSVISMQVRKTRLTAPIIDITTASGMGITITDADAGQFTIDEQVFDETPGLYSYDIQIEFLDGRVKTYIGGEFNLVEDVTHD